LVLTFCLALAACNDRERVDAVGVSFDTGPDLGWDSGEVGDLPAFDSDARVDADAPAAPDLAPDAPAVPDLEPDESPCDSDGWAWRVVRELEGGDPRHAAFATPEGSTYGGIVASWDQAAGVPHPLSFWFVDAEGGVDAEYFEELVDPIAAVPGGESRPLLVDMLPYGGGGSSEYATHMFAAADNAPADMVGPKLLIGVIEPLPATWPQAMIDLDEVIWSIGGWFALTGVDVLVEALRVVESSDDEGAMFDVYVVVAAIEPGHGSAVLRISLGHSFELEGVEVAADWTNSEPAPLDPLVAWGSRMFVPTWDGGAVVLDDLSDAGPPVSLALDWGALDQLWIDTRQSWPISTVAVSDQGALRSFVTETDEWRLFSESTYAPLSTADASTFPYRPEVVFDSSGRRSLFFEWTWETTMLSPTAAVEFRHDLSPICW